jgi:hypothetical protein
VAVALGWSSRPFYEFWEWPQYIGAIFGLAFPLGYWALILAVDEPTRSRPRILAIGLLGVLAIPFLALTNWLFQN